MAICPKPAAGVGSAPDFLILEAVVTYKILGHLFGVMLKKPERDVAGQTPWMTDTAL